MHTKLFIAYNTCSIINCTISQMQLLFVCKTKLSSKFIKNCNLKKKLKIQKNCCSLQHINCKISDRGPFPHQFHSTASSEIHMNSIRPPNGNDGNN